VLSTDGDDVHHAIDRAFEAKYPNVKVNREVKAYPDLQATAQLILTGSSVPDVININQGSAQMGPLVKAGLLRSLEDYAKQFGWQKRFAATLVKQNSFTSDGVTFGSGNLYGVSIAGDMLGVYYNKAKLAALGLGVPKSYADFAAILTAAKAKGEIPMQVGGLEKYSVEQVFQLLVDSEEDKAFLTDFIFGAKPDTFVRPATIHSATLLREFADKGYFEKGYLGIAAADAALAFAKGEGVLCPACSATPATIEDTAGKGKLGFFLLPTKSGSPVTTGGEGLAYSIPTKAKNPEVAAAFLDFMLSADAQSMVTKAGFLPAVITKEAPAGVSPLLAELFTAWGQVGEADGLIPYMEGATPTMFDTLRDNGQELVAGRITPEAFVQAIDRDATTARHP
jgi:raffinose/stachyose/melibiose transport system substrate-binding protein